jgi:type I restriction enzyme M protein
MTADTHRSKFLRALREIQNRSGLSGVSALSLTIARMLAAAKLCPTGKSGALGFLDRDRELTKADWLDMLRLLAERWTDKSGWIANPFDARVGDPFPLPGVLEQLRRIVLEALFSESTSPVVSPWLLQSTFSLTQTHGLFSHALATDLQDLITALAAGPVKARISCSYEWTAATALQLAAAGRDVTLDLPEPKMAAICACLALAADLKLQVRHGDPIAIARKETRATPLLPDRYDISIVAPPFGMRHSPHEADTFGTGLPLPSTIEAAGVTLAVARGRKSAICLLPPSFLFRAAKFDQVFKERVIREYGLDAVVGLPRGVFGSTNMAAGLLIFRPSQTSRASKSPDVFMLDARSAWDERKPDADGLKRLAPQIADHSSTDISISVSVDELMANDFNLLVERYVVEPELRRLRKMADSAPAVALDDIAELYRPQAITPPKGAALAPMQDVAEVGVADIDEAGLVRFASKQLAVSPDAALQARKARLEAGDVLLVIKGSIGKVGFVRTVPERMTWLASQSFAILRLRPRASITDSKVLFRFLSSSLGQANLQSLSVGTAVPGLQMADVRRLAITLPAPKDQALIAHDVDGLFALQDEIQGLRGELAARQGQIWPEQPVTSEALDQKSPRRKRAS